MGSGIKMDPRWVTSLAASLTRLTLLASLNLRCGSPVSTDFGLQWATPSERVRDWNQLCLWKLWWSVFVGKSLARHLFISFLNHRHVPSFFFAPSSIIFIFLVSNACFPQISWFWDTGRKGYCRDDDCSAFPRASRLQVLFIKWPVQTIWEVHPSMFASLI